MILLCSGWDQDMNKALSLPFLLRNIKTFAGDHQLQNGPNAIVDMLLDSLEKDEPKVHPHPQEGFSILPLSDFQIPTPLSLGLNQHFPQLFLVTLDPRDVL